MHRPLFDNILLDIAKEAGVQVLEGVKVDSFIYAEGSRSEGRKPIAQIVAAEAVRKVAGLRCGDDAYYADIIVIANGATTTFRSHDPRKEHITSCTAWFKNCSFTPGRIHMVFPRELSPHYAWLFPESDDRCNIGFCIKSNNLRGRKVLSRKVTDLFPLILDRYFSEVIDGAEMVISPRVFPMFPSRDIGTGALPGTVLVGDAARCINSYTGEGISYAVESGMIAAECIADFFKKDREGGGEGDPNWQELNRTYVARINRELGPGLRGGRFLSAFSPVLLRFFGLFSRIPVMGRLIPRMMTKMKG
jgi:flavin-dependent dehydrogenase